MKTWFDRSKLTTVVIAFIIVTTLIGGNTFADPGTEDDPLVTLSYVQKRIDQLKYYIDEKVEMIGNEGNQNTAKEATSLEVVELEKGQKLIGGSGTQIILRGGNGRVVGSELGGLSDVTSANDIQTDQLIPKNHLLIVPRDDGRGVHAVDKVYLMVIGRYQIIN
ncbi:hypothetical protein [Clostridiisalibacter paucivorans]|uniref:hypothetical protein n=1 Tax=Clostridiisalibacter paucivorans TaxID=408753 RepID=UPI00055925F9|nr:hypothetical protein [Clostridiisalibacter paucivorans]